MTFNSVDNYIRCCFDQSGTALPAGNAVTVEIYYARTEDLIYELPGLGDFIDKNERLRAEKFYFEKDKNTYIACHSLLRMLILNKLDTDPSKINIIFDRNNKPWLKENLLYFNLSHTRDAFAFAISDHVRIGIDLENINRNIDFRTIIKTFFSNGEEEYILKNQAKSRDRFFLLWTRKEALLKAIGTGIINKLQDVEVFRDINILNKKSFENVVDDNFFCDHYLYSKKISNHYLSLAVPSKAKISFHHLNTKDVRAILK
jgi:4'-phosphopantetheinyl transferase